MSIVIETVEDLKQLLKLTKAKVETVQELSELLTRLQAVYNPDIARVRSVKLISTTAISVSLSAAGICTFFAIPGVAHGADVRPHVFWAVFCIIAIMWISAGSVSCLAVLMGLRWLRKHQAPIRADQAANPANATASACPTGITEMDLTKFKREMS